MDEELRSHARALLRSGELSLFHTIKEADYVYQVDKEQLGFPAKHCYVFLPDVSEIVVANGSWQDLADVSPGVQVYVRIGEVGALMQASEAQELVEKWQLARMATLS